MATATAARRVIVGGNWKAACDTAKVGSLCSMLAGATTPSNIDTFVAPPALFLGTVSDALRETDVSVCAQNVGCQTELGAFTGELPAVMLTDAGINWTLVGHSERRAGFGGQEGESSAVVAEKARVALSAGMNVVACVGETLEEREAGRTLDVVLNYHMAALVDALNANAAEWWSRVVIAYEPVWAIGTGVTATPEQAQEVHAAIRKWLSETLSEDVANATRIMYGGSVKPGNADALIGCDDIDGFLVGGASLKEDFLAILNSAGSGSS